MIDGDAHDVWIVDYQQELLMNDEFAPVTPGEILKEEFLADYGLSQAR